jgi:hypothetical protein
MPSKQGCCSQSRDAAESLRDPCAVEELPLGSCHANEGKIRNVQVRGSLASQGLQRDAQVPSLKSADGCGKDFDQ